MNEIEETTAEDSQSARKRSRGEAAVMLSLVGGMMLFQTVFAMNGGSGGS